MIHTSQMPPQIAGRPDDFQTPPIALEPLYPYLKQDWVIWECACGAGNLSGALSSRGYTVAATDLYTMPIQNDFLVVPLQPEIDCIVTNPPFSLKDKFLARCYFLGKPFALLMPVTALGGQRRQSLYRKYGLQIIMLGRRVNFETPSGNGTGAWQEHAWIANGLNLPRDIMFAELQKEL